MQLTRRLKQFVNEVAEMAISEGDADVTREEFVEEYVDQIISDDFACVVTYAAFAGIAIPKALRGALAEKVLV